MPLDISDAYWVSLIANHRDWLGTHYSQHLKDWNDLLSNSPESALCEAAVRRFLVAVDVRVSPNKNHLSNSQSPDFHCQRGTTHFYVEVRSISVERASQISGLCDDAQSQSAVNPTSLIDAVFEICKEKSTQCASADAPVLLAIATAHAGAAMLSFSQPYPDMILCGMTTMTVHLNRETLKASDVQLDSKLYSAAFLKPDRGNGIESARSSISGLLLCGITLGKTPEEMWVVGLLNPNPARSFDTQLLPSVRFGSVEVDREAGQLHTSWPRESAE